MHQTPPSYRFKFLTKKLANKNISVERLIQKPNYKNKTASIIIITHESKEKDAKICLKNIKIVIL